MCRIAKADFEGGMGAPSAARVWMADLLDRWEVPWLSEIASLLISELVTNAIRHAKSRPVITAAIADGLLEVGVTDGRPDEVPQVFSTEDPTRDGGRGMAIVEALSTDWGMTVQPKAKHVWFRLEATEWSYLTGCQCHSDHANRVVLDSGRHVVANSGPWDNAND